MESLHYVTKYKNKGMNGEQCPIQCPVDYNATIVDKGLKLIVRGYSRKEGFPGPPVGPDLPAPASAASPPGNHDNNRE